MILHIAIFGYTQDSNQMDPKPKPIFRTNQTHTNRYFAAKNI